MTILIPAYQPDEKVIGLADEIMAYPGKPENTQILVVDDGGGEKYRHIFSALESRGIEVLVHEVNKGKGAALKTGFAHMLKSGKYSFPVVTADCDGQHKPKDIFRLSEASEKNPSKLILGCREFVNVENNESKVPTRNRMGNLISAFFFRLASGVHVTDTQTGLRAFSGDMLEWLCSVKGTRFEYEQNMLLESELSGFPIFQVPIATVYDNENYSTHYRPFVDSVRVMAPVFKHLLPSFLAWIADLVLVVFLHSRIYSLLLSVLAARAVSGVVKLILSKLFIGAKNTPFADFAKRFVIALAAALTGFGLIYVMLRFVKLPLLLSKIISDIVISLVIHLIKKIAGK